MVPLSSRRRRCRCVSITGGHHMLAYIQITYKLDSRKDKPGLSALRSWQKHP